MRRKAAVGTTKEVEKTKAIGKVVETINILNQVEAESRSRSCRWLKR
jgi:hypothetical protein